MNHTSIVTAAQMRWADSETLRRGVDAYRRNVDAYQLMDRAGFAVATSVLEKMPDYGRVVIVAGGGNNGGDGYAAARHLRRHRIPVTVVSLVSLAGLSEVVETHLRQACAAGVKVREHGDQLSHDELDRWLSRATIVVDAIFGTGLSRPLSESMARVVEQINESDRTVLSIDIPSGIHADTGEVMGAAVRADWTLPIAASKWGHWLDEGRDYTGRLLEVADIGIGDDVIREAWAQRCDCDNGTDCFCVNSATLVGDNYLIEAWPPRERMSHKGRFGHLWIFGGSVGYTGAPQLAGLGAYAAGVGLASVVCPAEVWPVIASANLEVMVHPEGGEGWRDADALVAGPGWGRDRGELLGELLGAEQPLVIDADGLNILADSPELVAQLVARAPRITVMTPHPGEAARLLDTTVEAIQRDRKQAVLALAMRFNCWVVLKGSESLIASPARDVILNPFGSPQLAIAGSGDVLSGMIGARLAAHLRGGGGRAGDIGRMIASAVALHGKAGEGRSWYLAGDLARTVSDVRHVIEQKRQCR